MANRPPCLGLIGGLGVGATVHYYKALAAASDAAGRALHLVMAHADMRRVFRCFETRDHAGLARYLAALMKNLEAAGATVAAIPAVTPHVCIGELRELSPLPIVSLLDVIAAELRAKGIRRAALFGTRFTIESGLFGALAPVDLLVPSQEDLEFIHAAYFQFAAGAQGAEGNRARLVEIAHALVAAGAETILLAGTDLTPVFGGSGEFPSLDCAEMHLRAIVDILSSC